MPSAPLPSCFQTVSASRHRPGSCRSRPPSRIPRNRHRARPTATAARSAASWDRSCLAILLERQIVDAAALEIDAAVQPRRIDGDARRSGDHRRAGLCRAAAPQARSAAAAGVWRRRRRRRRLRRIRLRLLLLLLRLLLHFRLGEEIFPADHDDQRQHDSQDGVLVVVHSVLVHWRLSARSSATPRRGWRTCLM